MRNRNPIPVLLAAGSMLLAGVAAPAAAAVRGTVINATAGKAAAGVMLTLSSFRGGMTPLEEAVSGADGSFEFTKDLPATPAEQPFRGAIRAEQDGVNYTEILRSDSSLDDVRITVYSVRDTDLPAPSTRAIILEPGTQEMIVRESYVFENDSVPPVTYSSEKGTLLFYLADEANGVVDVSGRGPAGMPLRSAALPTSEPGVLKVDFPLKPGQNWIDLSYVLPYEDGQAFALRTAYDTVETRVAVPAGVQLEGTGLTALGSHPDISASVFNVAAGAESEVVITGQGRFGGAPSPGTAAPAEISIQPAPIAKELLWMAGISILILGLGFYHLLCSNLPDGHGIARSQKG